MRHTIEQFQDKIARLFPEDAHSTETGDKKRLVRTVTFQVTDACNLRCTYCYQINKCTHSMPFEVAKKFFDLIINATPEDEYINPDNASGLVIEFIGGEPFLEIDLIDKITDYCIDTMIQKQHPWANRFMISICSNGVLYMDPRVQAYIKKHQRRLSFSISIDGNKELHDSCRVFPDGSGSYDIAIAGVKHFREVYYGEMGSKMTLAPSNIKYTFDAIKNIVDLGYKELHLNCVYEEGWTNADALVLYEQLKKVADYLIEDRDKFDNIYFSIFDEHYFRPKSVTSNENWCGGTGSMISCDYKGDIYPCIRYMESSLGDSIKPVKIGNVDTGIMKTPEDIETVRAMRAVTRRSQSTDKCFYCPIAEGCSWCSAYNYQTFGTVNKRATFICPMHIARALANAYLWNKANREFYPDRRFKIYVPEAWALEIISKDEWDMLKSLEEYTPEDAKHAAEFYANPNNPRMEDHEVIYDEDGLVKRYCTNEAEYTYEDLIDADQQLHNKDVKSEDVCYSDPFHVALGLNLLRGNKYVDDLYGADGLLNEDAVRQFSGDALTELADEAAREYNKSNSD